MFESKKILIVEDEYVQAKVLEEILKKIGYMVCGITQYGEEVLELVEKRKPDLILMDILLMGELDGIDIAKQVHLLYDIPVIYLTAYAEDELLERAKITEPFGYLVKPFEPRELQVAIELALYKYKADRELEAERRKAQRELENAFFSLARTVSRTLEYRDPYTAGHQRRVADLATRVGEKMGFDKQKLDEIYIGGLLHDIGKVVVPTDILSKPSTLTQPEFALIVEHCRIGYEIVKDAALPWNIGGIILNHHEKLDGSGYPRGIAGDEISKEVRIITVCDVVEAMSTLRPYRTARTKEEVIEELKKGSEIKYDVDVVDIILEMMSEREFDPWFSN